MCQTKARLRKIKKKVQINLETSQTRNSSNSLDFPLQLSNGLKSRLNGRLYAFTLYNLTRLVRQPTRPRVGQPVGRTHLMYNFDGL